MKGRFKAFLLLGFLAFYLSAAEISNAAMMVSETTRLPLNRIGQPVLAESKQVTAHGAMVVKGVNHSSDTRIVILRFDDGKSHHYHSRLNIERPVNPGPFELHLPLAGLKTPDKRLFNWSSWSKFYLFADDKAGQIEVSRVVIEDAAPFSDKSLGFDLGTEQSPVMTGMTRITKDYAGIIGKHLRAKQHASGNALTVDGIEGIKQLQLSVPNGQWDVVLWHRMPGEWENLPRQMNRNIKVQGKTVLNRKLSPEQWLAQDYLQGQASEAVVDGDLWQLHGRRDFEFSQTRVSVNDGLLRIDLAGATTHDNYLAGVFLSPSNLKGQDIVKLRTVIKRRFEQQWPVVNHKQSKQIQDGVVRLSQVAFTPNWPPQQKHTVLDKPLALAKDGFVVADFKVQSGGRSRAVAIQLTWQDEQGRKVKVPTTLRQGFWRYQRPLGASTAIQLDADELVAVKPGSKIRLDKSLSRRINLLIARPESMTSQKIIGNLKLLDGGDELASTEFSVNLLDIALPPVKQAVGIYHEKAVHWGWFERLQGAQQETLRCDYQLLNGLGLTALSPPLTTPVPVASNSSAKQYQQSISLYIRDLDLYQRFFGEAAFDYTTLKRFAQYYGNDRKAKLTHLMHVKNQLQRHALPMPQFAIVDEMLPLNSQQLADFSLQVADIRAVMPEASIAGQLNKPENRQLLGLLDTVLINHGYGVEREEILDLQRQGKTVWLYNMPNLRLAAGFYLWRSGAQGYLQWHGRMPTGEPYLPLDGREADFQLLYPSLKVCPDVPDINARLLAIAEGIQDRRWLGWLQRQASKDASAKRLLQEIKSSLSGDWAELNNIDDHQIQRWRDAIVALAQKDRFLVKR